jgi:tellurite methyltransferase
MNGGYDEGYRECACFWGTEPASYVRLLHGKIPRISGLRILDVGCGEGKNAVYLAAQGAAVDAIDVSHLAIRNGRRRWPDLAGVRWQIADVRTIGLPDQHYDVVIAYGLLHCLRSAMEIASVVDKLKRTARPSGYLVLCAFNDRKQDLTAHPGFHPCLLSHADYMRLLDGCEIIAISDHDLTERHPHNNIEHTHSLSRILAQKVQP